MNAFVLYSGLFLKNRSVWNTNSIIAVSDHNVPTTNRNLGITDKISRLQVETLIANCNKHNINYFDLDDINQGIVHVIGPELGITQPGMTLVCGDSHTSTHGALAALAFGIGCGHAFETTFDKEVYSDLTGERCVLMGLIQGAFKAQYDVLYKAYKALKPYISLISLIYV